MSPRRSRPAAPTEAAESAPPEPEDATGQAPDRSAEQAPRPAIAGTLSDLPVAGLTRRRIGFLLGAVVAGWVLVLFARQVGEASEAAARAEDMRASNAALALQVAALERELALIQRPEYVEQQARTYRLGPAREIPFTLADDAPPLAADAPGAAAVQLGGDVDRPTPLDSWLDMLFGTGASADDGGSPGDGGASGGDVP